MFEHYQYETAIPEPEKTFQAMRSMGYSLESAIADIVDNSITALADKIIINFGIGEHGSFVRIADNGCGMTENGLSQAMVLYCKNPLNQRDANDLGRFGQGLKTASFSQARRLTVKTATVGCHQFIRCWDIDIIQKSKRWILLKECVDQRSSDCLGTIPTPETGTIVLWEKLDRLVESEGKANDKEHFYRKFDNVRKHLGLIFHQFIESGKITIFVNEQEISAYNPFSVSPVVATRELQEEKLILNNSQIIIQPFILPHESKLVPDDREKMQMIKGATEHQGIYLYRNQRLIIDGSWLDLPFKKKESQRLCRICVEIHNALDNEWQIDIKKVSAKVPDILRNRLKVICRNAIEQAIHVYAHRGAYIRQQKEKEKLVYLWLPKQKNGVKNYHINRQHPILKILIEKLGDDGFALNNYIKMLEESIPISTMFNDFADQNIVLTTPGQQKISDIKEMYDKALRVWVENGLTHDDAVIKLSTMEIFQRLQGGNP